MKCNDHAPKRQIQEARQRTNDTALLTPSGLIQRKMHDD